jgi:phosphate transport system substrate-binding protein
MKIKSLNSQILKIPILSALAFFASFATARDEVRILSGGPTGIRILEKMKDQIEKSADVKLSFGTTKSDFAIKALASDKVEGMVAPALVEIFAIGEKVGMPPQSPADYQTVFLSSEKGLAVVHPDNPVKNLTHEQIAGILSGEIKNWKSINGKDEPLEVYLPRLYESANLALNRFYIKVDRSQAARQVEDYDGLARIISKQPNAIGFTVVTKDSEKFKPKLIETEQTFGLYFVMKKKAKPSSQKVFDYIKAHQPNQNPQKPGA